MTFYKELDRIIDRNMLVMGMSRNKAVEEAYAEMCRLNTTKNNVSKGLTKQTNDRSI